MKTSYTTPLRRIMAIPTNVMAPDTGSSHNGMHPAWTIAGSITGQASDQFGYMRGDVEIITGISTSGGAA